MRLRPLNAITVVFPALVLVGMVLFLRHLCRPVYRSALKSECGEKPFDFSRNSVFAGKVFTWCWQPMGLAEITYQPERFTRTGKSRKVLLPGWSRSSSASLLRKQKIARKHSCVSYASATCAALSATRLTIRQAYRSSVVPHKPKATWM